MRINICTLLLTGLFCSSLSAQYYQESRSSGVGTPVFEYTINRQFSLDFNKSVVWIFSEVLYDDLTFIKSDSTGFDAEIEFLIAIYSDEKMVFSRTITKAVNVADYENTNSRLKKLDLNSDILLQSGSYQLLLRTIDLNTKKAAQVRIKMDIPNYYEEEVALSDIMLLESVTIDTAGTIVSFMPILSDNFSVKEGDIYVYFNIFSKKQDVESGIKYSFTSIDGKVEFDTLMTVTLREKISAQLLKINKKIFKDNSYTIKIDVKIDDEEAENKKNITFYWSKVPSNINDIDDALRQMVYIMSSDSLSYFVNEASLKAKQEYFKRFWKRRDPNPKTEKNELMDEYFSRINFANENFSAFGTKGWQTDRGRILIKFGHPDDIERHPFELESRPYVIWRYYSLRKMFLFEDYTGFGDYRLPPEFLNEEYQ